MSALDELEIAAIRGGVDERVLNRARAERDAKVERAVMAEREACAVIVERHLYLPDHGYMETCEDMTDELASAIRARGEKVK